MLLFNTCWLEEDGRVGADGKGSGAGEVSRCLGARSRGLGEISPAQTLQGPGHPGSIPKGKLHFRLGTFVPSM